MFALSLITRTSCLLYPSTFKFRECSSFGAKCPSVLKDLMPQMGSLSDEADLSRFESWSTTQIRSSSG